ncbi:unnamed protein product [Camellia sinensis]
MASSSKPIITLVFIPILVSFFGTISHGTVVETDNITTTNVGVIIDVNSRIGKEQMTAMKIAVDNFNNKLSLYFSSSGGDPLQAAYAALVHSFKWRRVIVVYEEDMFPGDSNMLAMLSDALHNVDEARKMGFIGKDSAWVITDTIASFLDSVNSSFISSMEGVFGIKIDYSENTTSFQDFKKQFQQSFRFEYPEEDNSNPGIYALRAYDSIATVIVALERLTHSTSSTTSTRLLDTILSSNFSGLSGEIHFEDERLSYKPIYRVINVFNLTYNKLEYWSPEFGFLKSLDAAKSGKNGSNGKDDWRKSLGNLKRVPKGWAMPSLEDPLIIGVPGRAAFDAFVKITPSTKNTNVTYDGFCISVFKEVLKILDYDLPYKFVEFNGTYRDLVENVANKTFGGAVGDITILAERWRGVEFTQPITESGLSMVVPVKPASKAWIFLEPFTMEMWLATGAILIYTMFIVWFLEHRSNPEFSGPWKDQLGNVLWFTFSSLFLVHREKIQSNYTRDVLKYKSENVKLIRDQDEYLKAFKNGSISAAFLEIPYAKVFTNNYCMKYTVIGSTYRFGGFGFVFQEGSPIADDVSKAILQLSENGSLKRLEEEWLTPSSECLDSQNTKNVDSLGLESFWGLFLFSIVTSCICFLIFVAHLLRNYRHHQSRIGDIHGSDESVWNKTRKLARYLSDAEIKSQRKDPTTGQEETGNSNS